MIKLDPRYETDIAEIAELQEGNWCGRTTTMRELSAGSSPFLLQERLAFRCPPRFHDGTLLVPELNDPDAAPDLLTEDELAALETQPMITFDQPGWDY